MKKTYKIYTPQGEAEGEYNLIPVKSVYFTCVGARFSYTGERVFSCAEARFSL